MSNFIYDAKLYNEDVKNEFLSEYKESTRNTISRIFKVSSKFESDFNKDLYNFNREQIRSLLFAYMPKTEYSSKANLTWVKKYLDWCIEQGYLSGINPLSGISSDWAAQFVVTSLKQFWTEEELLKITSSNRLENAQDAVTVVLYFYGVSGKESSELLNLREKDVLKFSDELRLYDSFTKKERIIKVPEHVIRLCEASAREGIYLKSNGNPDKYLKAKPTADLVDNDFVIKSSITRTDHELEAEKNIVYRRFEMVKNEINENNFTPSAVRYSGMVSMAYKLMLEYGELNDRVYELVFLQFGENSEAVKARIKSEFLNLETIKSLYELP